MSSREAQPKCPICGYVLLETDPAAPCPECGVACGSNPIVIRPPFRKRVIYVLMVLVWNAFALTWMIRHITPIDWLGFGMMLAGFIMLLICVAQLALWSDRCFVLTDSRFIAWEKGRVLWFVRREDVLRFYRSAIHGGVRAEMADGSVVKIAGRGGFAPTRGKESDVRILNEALSRNPDPAPAAQSPTSADRPSSADMQPAPSEP